MYKMLFNTGVKRYGHIPPIVLPKFGVWINDIKHIEYYLEREPEENLVLSHLCDTVREGEIAIPIVDGGMLSKFAIFYKVKR